MTHYGVSEKDLNGDNSKGESIKNHSMSPEKKAQFQKIGRYAKGLHKRFTAANAAGKARDLEKKKANED